MLYYHQKIDLSKLEGIKNVQVQTHRQRAAALCLCTSTTVPPHLSMCIFWSAGIDERSHLHIECARGWWHGRWLHVLRVDTGPHHTVCCVEAAAAAQVGDFFGGVIGVGGGVLEEMQDAVDPPLVFSPFPKMFLTGYLEVSPTCICTNQQSSTHTAEFL